MTFILTKYGLNIDNKKQLVGLTPITKLQSKRAFFKEMLTIFFNEYLSIILGSVLTALKYEVLQKLWIF